MTLRAFGARRGRSLCLAVTILLLLAACGNDASVTVPPTVSAAPSPSASGPEDSPGASSEAASPSVAAADGMTPVFLIVFENRGISDLSRDDAPYLNSLAREYAHAANYYAVARPSQPNYLALFSGSTHGVADNEPHDIDAPTLADQIEEAGGSWRVAAENVPSGCFSGATSEGGPDGEGLYTRKHNPAISFTSISSDPARCSNIDDFSSFDPEAADFTLIVPNGCNSMHDCPVSAGDAWLEAFMPRIMDSDAYRDGGVIVITFDEDGGDDDNRVATLVISEQTTPGMVSDVKYTHYSLLRTIQELLGLPCLAESCNAEPMTDLLEAIGAG